MTGGRNSRKHSLERARQLLRELHHDLGLARRALLVSARMLEVQNADADIDVARLLREDIGHRLDAQIESTRNLIADLGRMRTGAGRRRRTSRPRRPRDRNRP